MQHLLFESLLREHVSSQQHLGRPELPDVEVVDFLHAGNTVELFVELLTVDLFGGGFQDDLVALFGDWPRRDYHQHREDVSRHRVEVVPGVELGDWCAVVRTHEVDHQGSDQKSDTLNHVG